MNEGYNVSSVTLEQDQLSLGTQGFQGLYVNIFLQPGMTLGASQWSVGQQMTEVLHSFNEPLGP